MTDFRTELRIGDRIQAARKQRGIKSTRDLADLIPGGNVTESILQNIEAGRKEDLSISQWLNIAFALKISPAFLLAPMGMPTALLDLAGLSPELATLTVLEFDSWLANSQNGVYAWTSEDQRTERTQLQAMRDLEIQLQERARLRTALELERRQDLTAAEIEELQRWDTTEERLEHAQRQVDQLTAYLRTAGWNLDAWIS
jgi:transcriptional regulator with XRE-family HTH domain